MGQAAVMANTAASARHVLEGARRRVSQALTDRMLELEQRRGVLGPAHRRWSGHSAAANRDQWTAWDWSSRGEEWNESEGWKQALIDDVLLTTIPAGGTVVEIGPGAGRWSEVLAPRAQRTILVDVTPAVLELCRERLGDRAGVEYRVSSGCDLPAVEDRAVDAIWSFDVFVHVAPVDQAGYLDEIARVLRPGGIAVVHHADGRNRGSQPSRSGWRAPMSAHLFAVLARECDLTVERQLRSWSDGRFGLDAYGDVITVMRR
jgi:ubiquinone/menaquinone biosynthesis C-methylase UbiE